MRKTILAVGLFVAAGLCLPGYGLNVAVNHNVNPANGVLMADGSSTDPNPGDSTDFSGNDSVRNWGKVNPMEIPSLNGNFVVRGIDA